MSDGISIRYVKAFDIDAAKDPARIDFFVSTMDAALFLAGKDTRDVPEAVKLRDACQFIIDTRKTHELP